jgi:hypothetical protein
MSNLSNEALGIAAGDDRPLSYVDLADEVIRLRAEVEALKAEHEKRRQRAEQRWTYPPIADLDRANEEVRRLRAYISEWASSQWDGDREGRYRDDPVWLKSAWHTCSQWAGKSAMEAYDLRKDVATLKRQIDVLVGFLVAYAPDCASRLKFYVLERDRLVAQVRALKREIAIQNEANRQHKLRQSA